MYPVGPDEQARVRALRALDILDTPPEPGFDDLVAVAAALCRAPIAIINFVDADRQWGKALVGLEDSEAPREASFCARTITSDSGLLVVPDTHADPAWSGNAQVTGAPHLRFYAGAAIVTPDGHAVGSICVADREPREIDAETLTALEALARQAADQLELRRLSRRLASANVQLRRLAVQDPLTGLANRTLLHDRLTQALRTRRRTGRPVGVLFGDVDGLKRVNDELGHDAGDTLLRAVAQRLSEAARGGDTVARLGGDEFAVVCPDLTAGEDVAVVRDRLVARVAQPLLLAGEEHVPRISIGAVLAADDEDADALLRRADAAMYAIKRPAAAR
jgi:diguanylate cyclase (GGDEF)-like protein